MKSHLFAVALVATLVAGCIAPPDGATPGALRNVGGAMTAKESMEENVVLCNSGVPLPTGGAFCAERTIRIDGAMSGISAMEIDLATFNGGIDVERGDEGQWSLTAVLHARGASREEALANLDRIKFTWSHVDGESHHLHAKAEAPSSANGGYSASIDAELPGSVVLGLSATTSNGAVDVIGVRTDGLSVQTSNGAIDVEADVTGVSLQTSNGAIDAILNPVGSGRMVIGTSNGAIDLAVPESARHGYELDAQTSNGKVTVNLRDGETTRKGPSNPYYDPQNDAHFRTHGFADRDIQSVVRITSSNGAISVDPK